MGWFKLRDGPIGVEQEGLGALLRVKQSLLNAPFFGNQASPSGTTYGISLH
jgi:hypothetical protein